MRCAHELGAARHGDDGGGGCGYFPTMRCVVFAGYSCAQRTLRLLEIGYKRCVHRLAQYHNEVDGHTLPIPHSDKLTASRINFVLRPGIRFAGLPGEQATLIMLDPFKNALEFKAFQDPSRLFAR